MRRVRPEQQHERLERFPRLFVPLRRRVDKLHHRGDGGVEAHALRLLRHLRDARIDRLELLVRGLGVRHLRGVEQTVRARQESRAPLDALGLPHLRLAKRTHEHLVQTERVGAKLIHDVVWVHHVPARLGHLVRARGHLDGLVRGEHVPVALLGDVFGGDLSAVRAGVLHLAQDHALTHKPPEGLHRAHGADVVQHLVPEARVQQVQHGVLGAAHVQVHGHPILLQAPVHHRVLVLRVDEPQVVPARSRPLRHGVGLASRGAARDGVHGVHPVRHVRQRPLAGPARLEVVRLRERQGEIGQGQRHGLVASLRIHHRERLAPVPLAREQPVAQLEVHLTGADAVSFEPLRDLHSSLDAVHAVHVQTLARAVGHLPGSGVGAALLLRLLLFALGGLDHLDDGQVERRGEFGVAVVVRRNRHDGAGAVRPEHVVRDPHRHVRSRQRVLRERPGEHASLLLRELGALEVRLARRLKHVLVHRGLLLGGGQRFHQRVLGSHHEVRRAEQRVRPGGVHLELVLGVHAGHLEGELRALRASDPVALHLLDGLGPVQVVEVVQEPVAVRGDL
mmetsp:Transcript_11103/g.46655  ORF Transcript_11103/g.46655 Transcript_11103/m.46655 type:complete len:564 (-) Transcript_11103:702-2393(-)